MNKVDEKLKYYIETNLFPEYSKNEEGHSIKHIQYVIDRCFKIIEQNNLKVNYNMVYVIAAYHDIGHHIDTENHEKISAEMMYNDKVLKEIFTEEELIIMKQAIEDHRASLKYNPRNIYGKIVSTADRNTSVKASLERTYAYGKEYLPKATEKEIYELSYEHLNNKFGYNGYAKVFFKDLDYEKFLEDIRKILENKDKFCKIQELHIKNLNKD